MQVCLSVDGLYQRCKPQAAPATLPTLAQLDVISNHVSDLALIMREAHLHNAGLQRSDSAKSAATAFTAITAH